MAKTKITKENSETIYYIVYGLVVLGILVFSLLSINEAVKSTSFETSKIYLFLVFLFLSGSKVLLALRAYYLEDKNKLGFFKNISFAFVYLVISILVLTIYQVNAVFYSLACGLYFATIVANRVCKIIEKRTPFSFIYNILIAGLASILAVSIIIAVPAQKNVAFLTLLLVVVMLVSFADVLSLAFSKIQLRGLLRIIRKTYVFEILYGLFLLIVSFSFFFMINEENVVTIGDGLWYSFAIVTTIGFGDITVTDPISRILSVILGIYGIIVVASITSVIVNYYNETKTEEKVDKPQIEEKKQSEEPASYDNKENDKEN